MDFSKKKYLLSPLRGAAEVLLTIGPWENLYAKVKLVKAARDQARLFLERFSFPMDSGAGFRTELADRKHILVNYKVLCTRWQETVGPWSTVAEEAAKFEAARKLNLTVTFGKHKGKHIDVVFEEDASFVFWLVKGGAVVNKELRARAKELAVGVCEVCFGDTGHDEAWKTMCYECFRYNKRWAPPWVGAGRTHDFD